MNRIMIGNVNIITEIVNNVFKPVLGEELQGVEILTQEDNMLVKYNLEEITFEQARIIEA